MRVFSLVPFLAFLPLLLAQSLLGNSSLSPLAQPLHERMALQSRATLDVCANIRVTIPGITLLGIPLTSIQLNQLCLCLDNGLLTQASKDRIAISFQQNGANAGLLDGVLKLVGGLLTNLLSTVQSLAQTILGGTSTPCVYPANSIPNDCSGNCGYDCDAGYKKCNGLCVPNAQTCATGGTVPTKRSLPNYLREDLRCPKGYDACHVPHAGDSLRLTGKAFDCVNSRTDLESCGGCTHPVPGQNQGVDCTALPSTSAVSCVDSQCVVQSCLRGFVLSDNACVRSGTGRMVSGEGTLWAARRR